MRVGRVRVDVLPEFAGEAGNGGERAASDHVALDPIELARDFVQPRGVSRGEVQTHLRVRHQEVLNRTRLAQGELMEDDVDLRVDRTLG
jgi:hypothetical protein